MAVKGLTPQLAERGKIKIGEKGEMKTSSQGKQFAQPRKLDHFLITTMQRDAAGRLMPDAALMARLKPEGGKITEVPVRLLYDDIDLNFMTRYALYRGNRCWCSGDGEWASRLGEGRVEDRTVSPGYREATANEFGQVPCPCGRQDPFYTGQDRCKILGTLQVLIEGTDRIGGVWKYRTTSWNTVNATLSSLALIKTITGGPLAGIPLHLVLSPKTVTVPTTGQNMVVYVVSLEYRGPEPQLAELGYNIARRRLEHQVRMEQVEAEARRLLLPPHAEPPEEQAETGAEFYPQAEEALPSGGSDSAVQACPVEFVTCETCGREHFKSDPCPVCLKGKPQDVPGLKEADSGPHEKTGSHPDLNRDLAGLEGSGITFPDLMEMVRQKGVDIVTPMAIRSHKSSAVYGVVEKVYWQGAGEPVLEIAFPPNLEELSEGLTPEMVIKSFGDAGIEVKAVQPGQGQEGVKVTELPDQGNGVLRVEIGPDGEEPPTPPDKKKKPKPTPAQGEGPASLF
jgi:hypothetical protein